MYPHRTEYTALPNSSTTYLHVCIHTLYPPYKHKHPEQYVISFVPVTLETNNSNTQVEFTQNYQTSHQQNALPSNNERPQEARKLQGVQN